MKSPSLFVQTCRLFQFLLFLQTCSFNAMSPVDADEPSDESEAICSKYAEEGQGGDPFGYYCCSRDGPECTCPIIVSSP